MVDLLQICLRSLLNKVTKAAWAELRQIDSLNYENSETSIGFFMAHVYIPDALRLILGLKTNPTAYLSTTLMVLAKDLYSYWILALTTNKKVYVTHHNMIICFVSNITFLTRYRSTKL